MSVNFIWYLAKQNKNENNNTWENSRAQSTTLNMHSHLSTFKVANRIHNACAILCEIFSTVFHLAICKATHFRERLVFILFHFLFAFNFMVFRIILCILFVIWIEFSWCLFFFLIASFTLNLERIMNLFPHCRNKWKNSNVRHCIASIQQIN